MTARWQKVIRDFRLENTRTVLVILAIATGLSAFSTVLSTHAILSVQLNEGYLATSPASATIWTDEVDDELLGSITAKGEVVEAEARREVAGRIKVGPLQWRDLTLIAVEDYLDIRVSRFEREAGAWPPGPGEILIERDALQVARAAIGDSVTVKTTRGSEQTLRVGGSVHDVGRAQARMENAVYGYVTLDTLALLGQQPYLNRIEILVAEPRYEEAHIRQVVADVTASIESRGQPVRHVAIPTPGEHPHAAIMGLLLLWMAAFGVFILILSGVIVANLMTALMASQVRQIGMLKAVGGSRGQIATIYLTQALLQGLAAVLIAVPAGIWGSRALCRYLAVLLNFDIESFAVPAWVWLLVLVVGLMVPLLAAAYPVWKWSGVTVREALADCGVGRSGFGTSALDRLLGQIGGLARPVLLAVRNSFRKRTQTSLAIMTLAVAGLCFMSALNTRASLIHTLDTVFGTRKYHLSLSLGELVSFESVERAVLGVPGVVHAEGWITTEGRLLDHRPVSSSEGESPGAHDATHLRSGTSASSGARSFPMVALPAGTTLLEPSIVEGRGLGSDDLRSLLVNTTLAASYPELKVGEVIEVQMGPVKAAWRVVGVAREPFSPSVAYVPLAFFEQVGGHAGMANSVRLVLENADPDSVDRVKADLELALERAGIEALAVNGTADGRYGLDQHMLMIYVFLISMSGLIVLVGGLGLMTTMSLNVLERRREMGVMRAMGASRSTVVLILMVEGWVIGLASWVVAAALAGPLSKALGNLVTGLMFRSDLDFRFDSVGLVAWLALVLLLTAAASLVPAWRASKTSVREALEYE